MYRYQLLIEYVGTDFIGWQIQKKGKTVQKLLQTTLKKILKENIVLVGSGRTDSGVHAKCQSAHFDIKKLIKNKKKIDEYNFSKFLFTENIPDPDLLIRTGNTHRLSNFLLWQIAYSEIYFERKLWPEFTTKDYNKILNKFKSTKRNFGNI